MTIIRNVRDCRFNGCVNNTSWECRKLDPLDLEERNIGATVIYMDSALNAEAGTMTSFSGDRVWARFHSGSTAAACDIGDLYLAEKQI